MNCKASLRAGGKCVKTSSLTAHDSAFFFYKKGNSHFCLNLTGFNLLFNLINYDVTDSGGFFCAFNFVFIFYLTAGNSIENPEVFHSGLDHF